MPILANYVKSLPPSRRKVRYIDGFAGPGIYERGEKGSPILALESVLLHSVEFPAPIELLFVEEDKERFASLTQQLSLYQEALSRAPYVRLLSPVRGDCKTVLGNMLASSPPNTFGPAFVFLDQFGYSDVPLDLISAVMKHSMCEVLSYLEYAHLNRFITDDTKHAGISRAFGGESWRPALTIPPGPRRQEFLLNTYVGRLKSEGGARYVWPFAMQGTGGELLYWLFFCTNNPSGLYEMKRAMWSVDRSGSFTFSDARALGEFVLFAQYDDDMLASDLLRVHAGKVLTVAAVEEWVLVNTPAYKFKGALKNLEVSGRLCPVDPPVGRRRGTFPDDKPMSVRFGDAPLF